MIQETAQPTYNIQQSANLTNTYQQQSDPTTYTLDTSTKDVQANYTPSQDTTYTVNDAPAQYKATAVPLTTSDQAVVQPVDNSVSVAAPVETVAPVESIAPANLQLAPQTHLKLKDTTQMRLLPLTQGNLLTPDIAKAAPLTGSCTANLIAIPRSLDHVNLNIDCVQPDSVADTTDIYEFTINKLDSGNVSNLVTKNIDGKWNQVALSPAMPNCQDFNGFAFLPDTGLTHTLGDATTAEFTFVPTMDGTALKVNTTQSYLGADVLCNGDVYMNSIGATDLKVFASKNAIMAIDLEGSALKTAELDYPFSDTSVAWNGFVHGKLNAPNTLVFDFSKTPAGLTAKDYTMILSFAGNTGNYPIAKMPVKLLDKAPITISFADSASDSVTLNIDDALGIDKTTETYVAKCWDPANPTKAMFGTTSPDPKVTVSGLASTLTYTCVAAVAPFASYKDEATWSRMSKQFDATTKQACINPVKFSFDPDAMTYTIGDTSSQKFQILPLDKLSKVITKSSFDLCPAQQKALGFDQGMFFSIEGKYADAVYSNGVKVDPKTINAWKGFVTADPALKLPILVFDFSKMPTKLPASDYLFKIYGNTAAAADLTGLKAAGVTEVAALPLKVVDKLPALPSSPSSGKSALVISKIDSTENTATVSIDDKDGLDAGQFYGVNCYVSTDEKNYQMAYDSKPQVMVGKLLSNTKYTCEAGAATPDGKGGYAWSRNSVKVETQTKVSSADLSKAKDAEKDAEKAAADLAYQLALKQKELDLLKQQYASSYNSTSGDSTQLDALKKQLSDTQSQVNDLKGKIKADSTVTAASQSSAVTSGAQDCSVGDKAFQTVCAKGIMTDYRPNVLIKRFEYALTLYRLAAQIAPNSKATQALYSCTSFKDYTNFSKEEWAKELCDSVKLGIVRGYQKTSTFEPAVNISYVEHYRALYQLYLALGLTNNLSQSDLKDAISYIRSANPGFELSSENRWYVEAVQFAIQKLSMVPAKDLFTPSMRGDISNDIYQLIK
jgi:hypothetical protein